MCKSALQSLSHHLESDSLASLLQAKLSPSNTLDYKPFLADLAPLLVSNEIYIIIYYNYHIFQMFC